MKIVQNIVVVLFYIMIVACSNSERSKEHSDHETHSETDHTHHHHEDMESMEISGSSIFNLESNWINQNADSIKLKQLDGKVKVMSMVYTHCQYACPRIVADMKMIEEKLQQKGIDNVEYVLVSIDPERDDPERLSVFAEENSFDKDHWTLITSTKENIQELAVVLGVQYKAVSETDFSHSNLITILSSSGEIMHRQEGLGADPETTIQTIEASL